MASVRHSSTDENSEREYQTIDRLIEDNLFRELSEFVAIQTYRGGALSEDQVVNHLGQIRDSLTAQVEEFNLGQKSTSWSYLSGNSRWAMSIGCSVFAWAPGRIRSRSAAIWTPFHQETTHPGARLNWCGSSGITWAKPLRISTWGVDPSTIKGRRLWPSTC